MNDAVAKPNKFRRIKTPTMIQIEATECGAVCLGIILGYFGRFIPIEELRIACGISRDGSNAKNIIEAAERYNLTANGFSMEVEDLYDFDLPAILYWKFEHFIVLEGFDSKKVFINDPATGPRTITYEELDANFTGVALSMKPNEKFQKKGSPPGLLKGIATRLKNVKLPLLFITLLGLLMVIPNLAFPALTQVFIDQILVNHNLDWKNGILGALAIIIGTKTLLNFLQGKAINRLKTRLSITFGSQALWHMLRLPMEFYMQRYPGEIAYRLTLNENINQILADKVITAIVSLLFAFAYGIAIIYYDLTIALVALGVIIANLLLMHIVYRARSDIYARYQADAARSGSYSIASLENIETIKASGHYQRFFAVWASYYTKVLNSLQDVGRKDAFLSVCTPLLQSLSYFFFIAIGGWRVLEGHLTVGMFIAVQILLFSLIQPILNLVAVSQSLQFLKVDMARLDDLMRYPIDTGFQNPSEIHEENLPKTKGPIDLQNITFGYSSCDVPLIRNFSLNLPAGKCIALVGPSGSGKSTLAKLIAGLLHPWEGKVALDGKDIHNIPKETLVRSLAFVEQDPFIFTGSIHDNIAFLNENISSHQVTAAAEMACLHDTIAARPGAYDLALQENGANLSGGERQRIEIARALAKKPAIIILDEATNSLDAYTENKIIQNIRNSGCTILMIAHRLSTIKDCDEIIMLEQSQIIARGSHKELKAHCQAYQQLIQTENKE